MKQKQLIKLDCLFLHNTQMADLEKEQAAMRLEYGQSREGKESELPFNMLPPFCAGRVREGAGRLVFDTPRNFDGWIVRPLRDGGLMELQSREDILFPGYPPLPAVPGFVLGFAGTGADACIPAAAKAFSVKVWYHAEMTVTIDHEKGKSYSVFYAAGPERWSKAAR